MNLPPIQPSLQTPADYENVLGPPAPQVSGLERMRQSNRDLFGMPGGLPPSGNGMPGRPAPAPQVAFPMTDPMNSEAYRQFPVADPMEPEAYRGPPMPPKRPQYASLPPAPGSLPEFAPLPPPRPQEPAPQPFPRDSESGWIDPAILDQQNAEMMKLQGKKYEPGDGVKNFVGNGGLFSFLDALRQKPFGT